MHPSPEAARPSRCRYSPPLAPPPPGRQVRRLPGLQQSNGEDHREASARSAACGEQQRRWACLAFAHPGRQHGIPAATRHPDVLLLSSKLHWSCQELGSLRAPPVAAPGPLRCTSSWNYYAECS